MKRILNYNLTLALAQILFCTNIFAQIPAGGTLLNATSGTTFQRIGKGTLTEIAVVGQPFTKGLRSVVTTDVNNSWDAQIQFSTVAGIATNDVILVAFYARTDRKSVV